MSFQENYTIPFEEVLSKYQEFWQKLYNIPKFSPFSITEESTNIIKNLQELTMVNLKLQYFTHNYLSRLNKTYTEALDKIPSNDSKINITSEQDLKKYRNVVLGTLEDSFTQLFQSKEFGVLISDLMSTYSEYNKLLKDIANKYLRSLNLPPKEDIDVILKDMQELKRQVRDLRKGLDIIMGEYNKIAK